MIAARPVVRSSSMSSRYRNIFFFLGVAAVAVMLLTFDMSWSEVWLHVQRSGIWLPAAVLLWLVVYIMNAWAWQLIIDDPGPSGLSFWRVLKYTISGYAINSVTPIGVLGGEPYRIMELTPYVGAARATSCVILYSMMHIFSHFVFWFFCLGAFVVMYFHSITWSVALILLATLAYCLLGIYFFMMGYRDGLAMRMLQLFGHLPLIGKRIRGLTERYGDSIRTVDEQIAALHAQSPCTFYASLLIEFLARMLGCLEYQFIFLIFNQYVGYWDCVIIQGVVSIFANLFFFMPMQMGSKEGGLAIVAKIMHMGGAYGVLVSLTTRLRELVWIAIGLALMRIGNKKQQNTEISK